MLLRSTSVLLQASSSSATSFFGICFPNVTKVVRSSLRPAPAPALLFPGPSAVAGLHTTCQQYAPPPKKAAGAFKAGMVVAKKRMEVETDPAKLVAYLCGGQYKKEGPEIKIGPESEYPDWLFTMRTKGEPKLEELDPQSVEYWEKVRSLNKQINIRKIQATKGRTWRFTRTKPDRYKDYIRQVKKEFLDRQMV